VATSTPWTPGWAAGTEGIEIVAVPRNADVKDGVVDEKQRRPTRRGRPPQPVAVEPAVMDDSAGG
jgi:hypothetical protein